MVKHGDPSDRCIPESEILYPSVLAQRGGDSNKLWGRNNPQGCVLGVAPRRALFLGAMLVTWVSTRRPPRNQARGSPVGDLLSLFGGH